MNELVKPTLNVDLDIKLPEIKPVEHNLGIIEEYTTELIKFYEKLVFTPEQYTEAKEERAKVNKLLKIVADNRKETVKKYKEPIDDFESTSKRIEKGLQQAANIIGASLEKFDLEEQEKKAVIINNKIEEIRNEFIDNLYPEYEEELKSFVIEFDKRWFNKTYKDSDLINDIKSQFNEKVDDLDRIKSDIDILTKFYDNLDKNNILNKDVYIERYKNIRDVNRVMSDMTNDYTQATNLKAPEPKIEVDPFAGLSINNVQMDKLHTVVFKCSDDDYKKVLNYMRDLEVIIMEER